MKVYIVEIHYDYETQVIHGIYSSKVQADEVAKELEKDESILDGVSVEEHEVI